MYKLTILKSSVEYILYLHHIIQKQHQLLSLISAKDTNGGILAEKLKAFEDFDIDFAKVPLNVNQYRNIDKDFNFKDLMQDLDGRSVNTESPETIIEENEPVSETSSTNNTPRCIILILLYYLPEHQVLFLVVNHCCYQHLS